MPGSNAPTPEKHRLLVVSPWGIGGGYSGPVMLLNRLFGELRRRHDVCIDVLYRDRGDEIVPEWVDRVYPLAVGTRHGFGRADQVKWSLRASGFISSHADDYHCVHLHGAYWPTLFPALFDRCVANLSLLPVLEAGDLSPGRYPQNLLQRYLRKSAAKKTIALFCLSEGIAEEARAAGWSDDQLVPIGNPVDGNEFYPVPRTAPTRDGVRLGFAGKLGPTKQPHHVLAAVAELVREGINASAIFVGPYAAKAYEEHFEQMLASLNLGERATVTGFTDNVAQHMRQDMDIFILPSLAEGMPGALAEAMSCGLPAVVTAVGEMGNVASRSKAGIVIAGDTRSIVDAVKRLISDGGLYSRMSERALAYAGLNYSSASIADCFFNRVFSTLPLDRKPGSTALNSKNHYT